MIKGAIKNVIVDQRELIEAKLRAEPIIAREGSERCVRFLSHPNVLLVSGMRRAGKSIFAHLLAGKASYAFLNFDDERLIEFTARDFQDVVASFHELYSEFEYLLFDEIQNIKGWELFINRVRENHKVIITGSNANLLSTELATHLTGRFNDHVLSPMSFREYVTWKGCRVSEHGIHSTKERGALVNHFNAYLLSGGIFEYHTFGGEFVRNLFGSIITKDISVRYGIRHSRVLEELALILINGFTGKISINKLARHLKVKSPHTIKQYIDYLESAFLFFGVHKFSYKVREQLATLKKIYCVDNGMVSSLIFDYSENRGRFLENLVAVELRRRGYLEGFEVFYWDDYHVECDFVIKRGKKIVEAYQVCSALTIENREREIAGLMGAMQSFHLKQGVILTESLEEEVAQDGCRISVIPVWKWLIQYPKGTP